LAYGNCDGLAVVIVVWNPLAPREMDARGRDGEGPEGSIWPPFTVVAINDPAFAGFILNSSGLGGLYAQI